MDLRWNDGSIIGRASTGVLQGDPLSTLYLFALGIQPLLSRLKSKLRDIEDANHVGPYSKRGIVFAIADDITIHAGTPDLFQLSSMLGSIFDSHQLPLNIDKSWIMGTQVFSQPGHCAIPRRPLNDGGNSLASQSARWTPACRGCRLIPTKTLPQSVPWRSFRQEPLSRYLNARTTREWCIFARPCPSILLIPASSPESMTRPTGIFSRIDDKINAIIWSHR